MSRIYAQQKRPGAKATAPSYDAPAVHAPSHVSGQSSSDLDAMMQAKYRQHFLDNQIPTAEAEADRIAASVSGARTPEEVKTQLGEKMGADFSNVTFHTDSAALKQADAMGARAYTTGSDVYFGQGGFDPGVAAHELVHTVQQGAVGSTMQTTSAPAGGVQMLPNWLKKLFRIKDKPKPVPHVIADDPMPAMYDYAMTMATRRENQKKHPVKPEEIPAAPVSEPAPISEPGRWKMGVSPRKAYMDQIDYNLAISANQKLRYNYLMDMREREAARHIAWHKDHVGDRPIKTADEGTLPTAYEGAFGTRVYSDDRYYQIMNAQLRTGQTPAEVKGVAVAPSEAEDARTASEALSRNLTTGDYTRLEADTVVHRGAQRGFGNALRNQLADQNGVTDKNLGDHIQNQIFSDPAFTSTSLNIERARGFAGRAGDGKEHNMVHAVLPKGLQTQFVSPGSKFSNEDEMLLNRNAPMRVLDTTTNIDNHGGVSRDIKAVYLRALAGGHRKKKK